jgi:hypothetical protein
MKSFAAAVVLLLALPFGMYLGSCAALQRAATPTHTIDALAAGPLILSVCDRHDELIQRDPVLVQAEKDQALRSTALVRELIAEGTGQ